ncbi:MAG: pilus assembly protein TadG-related protein [Pirellulales bacterium]
MKHLQPQHPSRTGLITVLAAFMSVMLLGMLAFSVDLGYILSAKEELQRTADAAAIAACWELGQNFSDLEDGAEASLQTRLTAASYSTQNRVSNQNVTLDQNLSNSTDGDCVVAYISNFYNSSSVLDTSNPNNYNVVRVRVRKNSNLNGEVPYFFARIFGLNGQSLEAEALAGIVRDVAGFQTPADGSNLDLLPFALDYDTWHDLVEHSTGADDWTWDETNGVVAGGDGILEVNLYPQGTGSPGNRGTVDIGSSNNSAADIARQILNGVSADDLAVHGGSVKFDGAGELILNGDTGISAGFKDELAYIKGQPRCIPIFTEVNGPGNTAEYTITRWFGIRIMDVKLTGPMSKKHVTIQAAPIVLKGVIPSTTTGTSDHVFSTVVLLE